MFKIISILVMVTALFVCASSGQSGWQGTNVLDVRAEGDDTMAVITDAQSNVDLDNSTRGYAGYIVSAGADQVNITSSSTMTGYTEDGEAQTAGTTLTQSFSNLPTSLIFGFVHQQTFDFSDMSDIISDFDTMVLAFGENMSAEDYADYLSNPSAMDPAFPDVNVFEIVTSEDALNEMVDEALARAGDGVTLEQLRNLQFQMSYDKRYSSSKNGESCYWGESKNKEIRLS